MYCPNCGSSNTQFYTETSTSGQDFSVGKGICGYILAGPIGVLCGFCGEGKKSETRGYWICNDCGCRWKA